ncbi:site-specific tyrosine recombinase XerC [Gemmata sp. SH-PL17]|uniref:tyrosine-type recombinase/integrase n=1 Tax=Gemmata sp. SH-PL17 TaxID=1630693 RepID=UPI00078DA667|nr:site-specific integrase [Gemmata sp. SH-PL17]AMV25118.1 site-specific tyrosine recombinase XerC [Gemmata sp. SH-PL17]
MPRPKNLQPAYKHHKPTNTARCWVGGKWVSLGRYGSPESRREHARILATLAAEAEQSPQSVVPAPSPQRDLTVTELLAAFMLFARDHYRHPDGRPTSELNNYAVGIRPLRDLFGRTLARDFGPKSLKAVRDAMVAAKWERRQINKRVSRIKRVFKWGASEELVPASIFHALQTVAGLQAGRSNAIEREPIKPVPDNVVDAVLPFLTRHVAGLVRFQRFTGCRPGEACALRRCDLDTSGDVWLFKPAKHKTAHRGKSRTIAIGPQAQAVLAEFQTDDPNEYVFSPAAAVAESRAARAAARVTPRYPSSARPRQEHPDRVPAALYDVCSYGHAVAKACERAFPPPAPLARRDGETIAAWRARLTVDQRAELKLWQKEHRFHPNQIRHSYATRVRKEHGLEAAQVLLGHAKADVTQVYSERNDALAVAIAAKIG